jgi:hypothetical protein
MLIEIGIVYIIISVVLFIGGCLYDTDGTVDDRYYYLGLVYGVLLWPVVLVYSIKS